MRIGYLECFSGISDDMFLGALVDAGLSPEVLKQTVAALGVGAEIEISRVVRSGISATKVDVMAAGEKELPREEYWEQHGHSHAHEQEHGNAHAQGHEQGHREAYQHDHHAHSHRHSEQYVEPAKHAHEHHHGRGLKEIREIIGRAAIDERAKRTAIAIFEALGAAEAKVHNTTPEKVHFHEVGAVDALVDIVGAAVGAQALGVDEWVCSPLNVGGGTVTCAHGTFPVPAPATVELLKHAPVYASDIQKELVTPTGAAIVNILATRFAAFPPMKIAATGYGAGTRDFPAHPNVLRLTIGEAIEKEAAAPRESIVVLEANVDDLNPQVFGYVMERLLAEGALDAFGTPVQMKKNRPGMLLTVLAKPEDSEKLAKLIFRETTTLGVRMREERRAALGRRWESVETEWGPVRMKVANLNGTVANYAPEYEDCRRIAEERGVPLKTVMQEAARRYAEKTS
jgi:hypothetical protein